MTLISLVIFWCFSFAYSQIPEHILNQMSGVRTRDDFAQLLKLESKDERLGVENAPETEFKGVPIQLNTGSFSTGSLDSTPETFFRQIDFQVESRPSGSGIVPGHGIDDKPPVDDGVETISNPVQSEDKCEAMNVCVPTPVAAQPNVMIFPKCIELPQCLGSCCDGANKCHAQQKQPVRVLVERWIYKGLDPATGQVKFDELDKSYYLMEKHLSCGCQSCRVARSCPSKQEMKECQCKCKNAHQARNCSSPWVWSEESCSCECSLSSCPAGRLLDTVTCSCQCGLTSCPVGHAVDSRTCRSVAKVALALSILLHVYLGF